MMVDVLNSKYSYKHLDWYQKVNKKQNKVTTLLKIHTSDQSEKVSMDSIYK